ncbi:MAG: hypothetical protein RQ761_10970 [Bacteroidales bacterium]|nr:hypothetical protein [Bacteroidales bacterium]
MKTRKSILAILMILGLAIIYSSCKKDETTEPELPSQDTEVKAVEDDAIADKLFSEVTDIINEAVGNHQSMLKNVILDTIFMGPCATVTIDTLAFPHTVTIDFGPVNCLCRDGKLRRGKINVSHTGPYWAVGTVVTTTFDNYFVNDHQLLGTKVVTNMGPNSSGNPTWTIDIDGQVIKPDGEEIIWIGNRMREWVEGHGMPPFMWWDDVYHITGSHNVVASNGTTLSATIIEPLEIALNCYWIRSGVIEMQHSEFPLVILNYGDGTCDDQATVTINGVTFGITL